MSRTRKTKTDATTSSGPSANPGAPADDSTAAAKPARTRRRAARATKTASTATKMRVRAAPAKKAIHRRPAAKSAGPVPKTVTTRSVASAESKPRRVARSRPATKTLSGPAEAPTVPAVLKPAKLKPVRDSFTMPRADFDLVDQLKDRALGFKRPAKKSELLRAGLHALQALDDAQLKAALDSLLKLKPGRPKKKR